jgi:hypothetical protein
MNQNVQTPDWLKNAIFYQIFPDRFATREMVEKAHIEPRSTAVLSVQD